MKIKPAPGFIQIKPSESFAGSLDTSSRESAKEYAEVVAIGEDVHSIKKGDFIFYKSWAVDIINHNDKNYYFVNLMTHGVPAIVSK